MLNPVIRHTVLAVAVLLFAAPLGFAQDFSSERVLRTWDSEVKLDNDQIDVWTFTITYDPVAGEYARTVLNSSGALVEREVSPYSMAGPTDGEIEFATNLIMDDPELRPLLDRATRPLIDGGFEMVRMDNPACAEGSRCLQFDVMDVVVPGEQIERIRYVVVDMRTGQILNNNLNPDTESNIRRPNRTDR